MLRVVYRAQNHIIPGSTLLLPLLWRDLPDWLEICRSGAATNLGGCDDEDGARSSGAGEDGDGEIGERDPEGVCLVGGDWVGPLGWEAAALASGATTTVAACVREALWRGAGTGVGDASVGIRAGAGEADIAFGAFDTWSSRRSEHNQSNKHFYLIVLYNCMYWPLGLVQIKLICLYCMLICLS